MLKKQLQKICHDVDELMKAFPGMFFLMVGCGFDATGCGFTESHRTVRFCILQNRTDPHRRILKNEILIKSHRMGLK